jgi:hypothetical protein
MPFSSFTFLAITRRRSAKPFGRWITGIPVVQSLFGGVTDKLGGIEIGLADAQVDDSGDLVGQGKHDADARPFDFMGSIGQIVWRCHIRFPYDVSPAKKSGLTVMPPLAEQGPPVPFADVFNSGACLCIISITMEAILTFSRMRFACQASETQGL